MATHFARVLTETSDFCSLSSVIKKPETFPLIVKAVFWRRGLLAELMFMLYGIGELPESSPCRKVNRFQ